MRNGVLPKNNAEFMSADYAALPGNQRDDNTKQSLLLLLFFFSPHMQLREAVALPLRLSTLSDGREPLPFLEILPQCSRQKCCLMMQGV